MFGLRCIDSCAILSAVSPFGAPSVPVLEQTTEKGLQYAIYLPPNYDTTKSYNLLVHLHGACVPYFLMLRELKLTGYLLQEHSVQNLIVLAPHDATKWSLWVDGDAVDMATQVFDELLPQIQNKYNIQKQFLQGFSMGGFGAAVHGHRFAATVIWDGALHDWESLLKTKLPYARQQFSKTPFTVHPYTGKPPAKSLLIGGSMPSTKARGEQWHQYMMHSQRENVEHHQFVPTTLAHAYRTFALAHFDKAVALWMDH
ncbi:expressed unknown protein [Seminavis robusta]|uniref:Uncharacterized protein n=1 Tax=Seminavis robusta TaxID=568900 RepID=A0A9N8HGP3_9STRA|nr:expressed unknown protein [Seminavis robusta]|eukprot:Sro407_g136610.1 n/a (256) ;mRNA; f:20254-21021